METDKRFDGYLKEKIDRVESGEFNPRNFKELWELKREIIADAILNVKENTEHYIKFAERVKTEPYFRLQHICELGLPFHILIFISEKNIGKSRQMLRHMDNAYNRGKKFVIMRSLDVHLNLGLAQQLSEEHSNFNLSANGKIYHKTDRDESIPGLRGTRTREAGYAMSLSTCTKWKGGSFDDCEFIWFDEATDEHKDITVKEFRKLFISVVNSIERRKEDFTIIITGNTDFTVSHPLFEYFEIDPEQNLVYTKRKAPGALYPTNILYINSRGLYAQGAKSSRFIGAGGDPKDALDAFMNSVKNNTERITALDLTYLADPFFCVIFKDSQGEEFQLVIAKHNYVEQVDGVTNIEEKEHTWYYLKIEPFKPEYLYGYRIYTDDITMHTLYRDYTLYKKTLNAEWSIIRRIIRCGRVIFVKKETKLLLFKMLGRMTQNLEFILG